jgi:hypothetical protein
MKFIVTYLDKYGDAINHNADSFRDLKKFIKQLNKQNNKSVYLQIKNK